MARKAIVNKDIILSMLSDGETTQRIAEKFNVTRQAIDLYRREFIDKGILPDQRASRTRKALNEAVSQKQNMNLPGQLAASSDIVSLDEQIELIIKAFHALKRLPKLEKEIETYKLEYENARKEIERLKENEKKRLDQESRWIDVQHHNNTWPA